MKQNFFCAILLVLGVFVTYAMTRNTKSSVLLPRVEVFPISKGINLSECLERDEINLHRIDSLLSYKVLDTLRQRGFDHVRIPVSEKNVFDEKLQPIDSVMTLLDDRIRYCHAIGLKTILDLHVSRVHKFTKEDNLLFIDNLARKHFMSVWTALQKEFIYTSIDSLAYECLNEPAAPIKNHQLWNDVLSEWISLIRKKEKERILFVGFNRGNQIWTCKYLKLPQDTNIVLTFHYYSPSPLTHYRASFNRYKVYYGAIHYPGELFTDAEIEIMPDSVRNIYTPFIRKVYNKERMQEDIEKVVKTASDMRLQLNCSEFGCLRTVPDTCRYRWFEDLVETFNKNGISYTVWGLNGAGFGIYNYRREIDNKMLELLVK